MNGFRRHLTYANIVGTVALFLALGGGAMAASSLTGAAVKDHSLDNNDFKNASLTQKDLSGAALAALIGKPGPKGIPGPQGTRGIQGPLGPQGVPGDPAQLTSSWSWNDTGLVIDSADEWDAPNSPPGPWDSSNYGSGHGAAEPNIRTSNYVAVNLTQNWTVVDQLSGMTFNGPNQNGFSQGDLTLVWPGKMEASATVTLLHRNNGEDTVTNAGGSGLHSRVECRLAYGVTGTNVTGFDVMGIPQYESSDAQHDLVSLSFTGNADTHLGLLPANSYDVALECRDPDFTGTTEWSLANGSMTVLGSAV